MGRLVAEVVDAADDLQLTALYDPGGGPDLGGVTVSKDPDVVAGCSVVVEFTRPDVVMENLGRWRALGASVVVGTSGFDEERLAKLGALWPDGPPNVLVVPNFSVGAVVMMRLSELAAPHFSAAEVIELHHDEKVDAPSGTALATAGMIAAAAPQHRQTESKELVVGARGADVGSVPVHAVRLPGLVAHQEVIFGGVGESLTIRHDTIDRRSFLPGVLLGIRSVGGLEAPLTVGLGPLLGI
jgi:4-hydroxy-tetrahydrodipicolinate reductase